MSLHDYTESRRLEADDAPFYGLIMAAMRRADTMNAHKLREAFPEVWEELQARYDAPAGILVGEANHDQGVRRTEEGLVDIETGEVVRAC